MPWEVSHLSSHSPGKSVYRSQKKSEQKEGRAVVWSVWMINLKWRLQNATDTFTGSGRESFVGAMDAILSCTDCCHLCITVQPNLCCWQLCSLPCSCPRNFFFFFFLVPSCGKFLNSCFKSATQKRNPPSCGPAVAENSILLLLLLVWGPPKLPSLKASIKPAEGLITSSSPEFGGIITRVAGFT